ncbi:MAG: DUF5711 family protein [Clostridium sp.]
MKKKLIIIGLIISVLILLSLYISNTGFRKFIDRSILNKEVKASEGKIIYTNAQRSDKVFLTSKHVHLLSNGEVKIYDKEGRNKETGTFSVGEAISASSDKYLAIADKSRTVLYFVEEERLLWERNVDSQILKININRDGYVSVITKNSIYKAVVTVFSPKGEELFKTYVSSGYIIDTDISNDNNFLAIGEVNYNKSKVNSEIKIINIKEAVKSPDKAVVNSFQIDKLLVNLKFKERTELLVQTPDTIYNIGTKKDSKQEIYKIEKDVEIVDIETRIGIVVLKKENVNLFKSNYELKILSEYGKELSKYNLGENSPKEIKVFKDLVAINTGTEIQIINLNGWEKKRYKGSKEVKDFKINSNTLLVIYTDRMEIINI